jgi:DNA-binding SARP family transcriptional activator
MEFRVLGPLEVVDDEGPLALQAGKQRALLACLLLRANRVVSSETLIDVLWGEDAPETAMHTLHVYVSQLRKVLRQARSPHHAGLVTEGRGCGINSNNAAARNRANSGSLLQNPSRTFLA